MNVKDKNGRRILQNLLNPQPENAPPEEEYERDPELDEMLAECFAEMRRQEAELEEIKKNRPLGSVVHREPKSLMYSKIPDPIWKRKLRP